VTDTGQIQNGINIRQFGGVQKKKNFVNLLFKIGKLFKTLLNDSTHEYKRSGKYDKKLLTWFGDISGQRSKTLKISNKSTVQATS
jgi:hypothetical protein